MAKRRTVRWRSTPTKNDYVAATSYLTLVLTPARARASVQRLRRARLTEYPAKDLLRAARLPLLPVGNAHVKRDEQKILDNEKLSPLLLVRQPAQGRLIIADGYHRLCAVYAVDEDAVIPCQIV